MQQHQPKSKSYLNQNPQQQHQQQQCVLPNIVSSIYMSSFNMNGTTLTTEDAEKWLSDDDSSSHMDTTKSVSARDADLVILSLQECPTYPDNPINRTPTTYNDTITTDSSNYNKNLTNIRQVPFVSAVLGPPKIDEKKECDDLPTIIQTVLSDNHILIADIAMGEPATSEDDKDTMKGDRFYGFIRLMIYTKRDLTNYIFSSTQKHNGQSIIPILCPVGRKRTSTYYNDNNGTCTNLSALSSIPKKKIYDRTNPSPDKGGVCIAIPSLRIIICSLHLCGTNKYHTLESKFDSIRIEELISIEQTCNDMISSLASSIQSPSTTPLSSLTFYDYQKIVLGDLNFRVEVCTNEKDKGRGGLDYQSVMDVIMSRSKAKLDHLFWNNDRLVQLLHFIQVNRTVLESNLCHSTNATVASIRPEVANSGEKQKQKEEGDGNNIDDDNEEVEENEERELYDIDLIRKISLLQNVVDVYMEYFSKESKESVHIMDIPPTFTFPINKQHQQQNYHQQQQNDQLIPRIYSDKRTPSWTDRILIDKTILNGRGNRGYEITSLVTKKNVLTSDHIPLNCFFQKIA